MDLLKKLTLPSQWVWPCRYVRLFFGQCTKSFWMSVPPVPSLADIFSIFAYAFLSFYVFSTYLRFYKIFHFSKKPLIATVIATSIFLFFIISYRVSLADLSSSRGIAIFCVIVAYPVLDAIIMVPSFLIV